MTDKSSTTLNTNTVPEDPAIVSLMSSQHGRTVEYVNQPMATSTEELSAAASRYTDTAILDYIQHVQTSAVTAALGSDRPVLSIAAPFSRTAVFPAGEVSVRDIAGLYIYDNTLEAVTLVVYNEQVEIRQALIDFAAEAGTIDPATFFEPNWRLVREGVPVF